VTAPHGVFAAIWSLYMADRGASLAMIGLSFTAFSIPTVFLSPLAGRVSDRYGRYWPIALGLAGTALIYFVYATVLSPVEIILLALVEGVGMAIVMTAVDGLLADVTPPAVRGRVQANFTASGMAGMFLGSTAAGFLYDFGPGAPFLAAGVLTIAVAGLLF